MKLNEKRNTTASAERRLDRLEASSEYEINIRAEIEEAKQPSTMTNNYLVRITGGEGGERPLENSVGFNWPASTVASEDILVVTGDEHVVQRLRSRFELNDIRMEVIPVVEDEQVYREVEGTLRQSDDTSLENVRIRVFHKRLNEETRLAETTTDEDGNFAVEYSQAAFRSLFPREDAANVLVRAYNGRGEPIAESEVVFNADEVVSFDLLLDQHVEVDRSEFEDLREAVEAAIGNTPLTTLTADEIEFATNDIGIADAGEDERFPAGRSSIDLLVESAQAAAETDVPMEVFYALRRASIEFDGGLGDDREQLKAALSTAVEENIIPSVSSEDLDDVFVRLESLNYDPTEVFRSSHTLNGTLVIEDEGDPVRQNRYLVRLTLPSGSVVPAGRPIDIVGNDRMYSFTYLRRPEDPAVEELEIQVLNDTGDVIATVPVSGLDEEGTVTLSSEAEDRFAQRRLDEDELRAQLSFSEDVIETLTQYDITTLADVRRNGTKLETLEGTLPEFDQSAVSMLRAYAALDLLSTDLSTNSKLIEAEFTHPIGIAETPREEFLRSVDGVLSMEEAQAVYESSQTVNRVARSLYYSTRADVRNGLDAADNSTSDPLLAGIGGECSCHACDSGISPRAYLLDLLDFVIRSVVRSDGNPMTLEYLSETFHQPFLALASSCDASQEKVHHVRLVGEMLLSHLGEETLQRFGVEGSAEAAAMASYKQDVYKSLLLQLGTSYEELQRVVRYGDDAEKRQLSDQLGIRAEILSDLLFFLDVPLTQQTASGPELNSSAITEDALETTFGFPALTYTTVETVFNVPEETSLLYPTQKAVVKGFGSNETIQVERVDNGVPIPTSPLTANGEGIVEFAPQATEKGEFRLTSPTHEVELTVSDESPNDVRLLVPDPLRHLGTSTVKESEFYKWQLEYLRRSWAEEQFPETTIGTSVPVIDPDRNNPGDFRRPTPTATVQDSTPAERAFALWVRRREWVDARLEALNDLSVSATYDALVTYMGEQLRYDSTSHPAAWKSTPSLQDLVALREDLESHDETVRQEALTDVSETYRLTEETFKRLVDLFAKRNQPASDRLSNEEWGDLRSILVQAQKSSLNQVWIDEERSFDVTLGPDAFWVSSKEPEDGIWSLEIDGRFETTPFIDPEIVAETQLPAGESGRDARNLRTERQDELTTARDRLGKELRESGLDAVLQDVFGTPWFDDPQDPNSDTRWMDHFVAQFERRETGRRQDIEALELEAEKLHLEFTEYETLLTIAARSTDLQIEVPSEDHLAAVLDALTTAWKLETRYPNPRTGSDPGPWIEAERNEKVRTYWRARQAKLPVWRADRTLRQEWQDTLRANSCPPVIDPDLITELDLVEPSVGNAAFDLLVERRDKIADVADDVRSARTSSTDPEAVPQVTRDEVTTLMNTYLGLPLEDLETLASEEKSGVDIEERVEQLSLSFRAFRDLLGIIERLDDTKNPVFEREWRSVDAILTQVYKKRQFGRWHGAERNPGQGRNPVTLSPVYFQERDNESETPAEYPKLQPELEWRLDEPERRRWERTLSARIKQVEDTSTTLAAAVDEVEEEFLPGYRDALIREADFSGPDAVARLSNRILTDLETDGCQSTTRASHAIDIVQGIAFAASTGTDLELPSRIEFTVREEEFNTQWQWLRSYAIWQSGVLVLMYPENFLLPTVCPAQTPVFSDLFNGTSIGSMTPSRARKIGRQYYRYLLDILSLRVQTTCETTLLTRTETDTGTTVADRRYTYLFGQGNYTKNIYWSVYDPEKSPADAQSYWEPLFEPSGDTLSVKLIGAQYLAPVTMLGESDTSASNGSIFLLVQQQKRGSSDPELAYALYDLDTQRWGEGDSEIELTPVPLSGLPSSARYMTAQIVQTRTNLEGPRIYLISNAGNYLLQYESPAQRRNSSSDDEGEQTADEWKVWPVEGFRVDSVYNRLLAVLGNEYKSGVTVIHEEETQGQRRIMGTGLIFPTDSKTSLKPGFPSLDFTAVFDVMTWQGAVIGPRGLSSVFWQSKTGQSMEARLQTDTSGQVIVSSPRPSFIDGLGSAQFAIASFGREGFFRMEIEPLLVYNVLTPVGFRPKRVLTKLVYPYVTAIGPAYSSALVGTPSDLPAIRPTVSDPGAFRLVLDKLHQDNLEPKPLQTYLYEGYYFLPMYLGTELQTAGYHQEALDWLQIVYDYNKTDEAARLLSPLLRLEADQSIMLADRLPTDWIAGSINPHSYAAMKANAYTRYTIFTIVEALLKYADQQFTRDTIESVSQARKLYQTATNVLNSAGLKENPLDNIGLVLTNEYLTADRKFRLELSVGKTTVAIVVGPRGLDAAKENISRTNSLLQQIKSCRKRAETLDEIAAVLQSCDAGEGNVCLNDVILTTAEMVESESTDKNIEHSLLEKSSARIEAYSPILAEPSVLQATKALGDRLGGNESDDTFFGRHLYMFCVPKNPVLSALRSRAKLNLEKIRNCRNIAGMERELEPYAAPTDVGSVLPAFGSSLPTPAETVHQPTPYRYGAIVERAKELVNVARQVESDYIRFIERREEEEARLLEAKQNVREAKASVRLQELRFVEAKNEVALSELQRDTAVERIGIYESLKNAGLTQSESALLKSYLEAARVKSNILALQTFTQIQQAIVTAATADPMTAAFATAAAVQFALVANEQYGAELEGIEVDLEINRNSFYASHERRLQEFETQKQLAQQDERIGNKQITLAINRRDITDQERTIAELQSQHAESFVNFLAEKLMNKQMYEWIVENLANIYRYFLQQATAMAKLAEQQLAFERQQTLPRQFIKTDYWEPPSRQSVGDLESEEPDRKGFTGAERLLQDVYDLDQYAFTTNERKHRLKKTISLAQLTPVELQEFRETGVLSFATPMELFDRDYPGHYLRLIKRVDATVLALTPPGDGVKATLSTSGISRVVTGGLTFQTRIVRRLPESIALNAPQSDRGAISLRPDEETMLLPFENMGVDTTWQLSMPKASNRFDYNTIADVLVTIEYTALDSYEYRNQVMKRLGRTIDNAQRVFSVRDEFVDQWYDLNNPIRESGSDQVYTISTALDTSREDFPANIDDLTINHVRMYFVGESASLLDNIEVTLEYDDGSGQTVGGSARPVQGKVSTDRINGSPWRGIPSTAQSVSGIWRISLPNRTLPNGQTTEELFKADKISDVLFIVEYSGQTAPWPTY